MTLWFFNCERCHARHETNSDSPFGPNSRLSVTCKMCGLKSSADWQEENGDENQKRTEFGFHVPNEHFGTPLGRSSLFDKEEKENPSIRFTIPYENPEVERLEKLIKTNEQRHEDAIKRVISENESKLEQYKSLANLISEKLEKKSKRDKTKSALEKKEIDVRLAEIDVKVAHMEDVLGFKLKYR